MFTFQRIDEDQGRYDSGIVNVSITVADDSTIDDMCEAFKRFLLAAGYSVNGTIVYEKEEK